MGYITSYYGGINLVSKKAIKIIKKLIENSEYPFEEEDVETDEDGKKVYLRINCNWKDYENEMEKLCLFVAMLDKKSYGVIECNGEEADDLWRIVISKGKVFREQGYIKYQKDYDFDDTETKKKVYEFTKDKKLLKELIVENLK